MEHDLVSANQTLARALFERYLLALAVGLEECECCRAARSVIRILCFHYYGLLPL